jgi:phosphonate transport system substrate-binding protein
MAAALVAGCGRDEGASGVSDPGVIRLSILSPDSAQTAGPSWAPIIKDMAASTGLEVRPIFSSNFNDAIELMRDKKTDLGWFSNESGLEAVRRGNGEVFARTLEPSGADGYTSVLIVNAKSKLTLDRVLKCDRSLTLGLGEALSVSGALAPETYLFAPRGVRPGQCFKQVRSANPQTNLAEVASGQLDLAANNSTSLSLNSPNGRRDAGLVRVIWRSPPLPEYPIIWRKDLDPAIKEKLRQFFLTYGQGDAPAAATQRANLARIDVGGFKPADNSHLLPVREMEATRTWLLAKEGGDKVKIEAARKALDDVTAQREALEARTRAPAAAQ